MAPELKQLRLIFFFPLILNRLFRNGDPVWKNRLRKQKIWFVHRWRIQTWDQRGHFTDTDFEKNYIFSPYLFMTGALLKQGNPHFYVLQENETKGIYGVKSEGPTSEIQQGN